MTHNIRRDCDTSEYPQIEIESVLIREVPCTCIANIPQVSCSATVDIFLYTITSK